MAFQQNQFKAPNVQFRVLIIGRANAGKTSILQRVCDTTESPRIYRLDKEGQRSQVRSRSWWRPQSYHLVRATLTLQLRFDKHILSGDGWSWPWRSWLQRGYHDIDDELIFEKHDGYIFHDSRGFEAGSEDELKIVQEFVQRKSREGRLKDRLHAIWFVSSRPQLQYCKIFFFRYCIPMDNDRPSLDLKYFDNICPDKNGMSTRNYMNWDWHGGVSQSLWLQYSPNMTSSSVT